MSFQEHILERVVRRDRVIVVVGLAAVSIASWLYILAGAGMDMGMGATTGAMLDMTPAWPLSYFALMLVMWWVMMVAMMLPSAAPTVLLFATVREQQRLVELSQRVHGNTRLGWGVMPPYTCHGIRTWTERLRGL